MTSLSTKLAEREASGKPIQIGLIGAGKFGSMLYVSIASVMSREHHASIDVL
jgi:predicted homoserine dehydrogenase-like protein